MFGKKSEPVAVVEQSVVSQPEPARNWVAGMAATAKAQPVVGNVQGEIKRLSGLLDNLLPIEREAGQAVSDRIEELKAGALPYPKLSLEPFRWRKDDLPVFAVYGLDSPMCSLAGHDGNGRPVGRIPHAIRAVMCEGVEFWGKNTMSFTNYWSTFSGLIPAEVRIKIAEAKPHFADDIFIVAEANWKKVVTPRRDPLVVGWKAQSLWLIAQFDTTDLENYFATEFPG